jgi:hypothetical protein
MAMTMVVAGAALGMAAAGCAFSGDGTPYEGDDDRPVADAGKHPGFRDASCPGGGPSGTSGSSTSGVDCGDVSGSPTVDAGTPCDLVTFTHVDPDAASVWVTGDFTGWAETPAAGAWEMTGSGGAWSATGQTGAGEHRYKFVVDGERWIADPGSVESEPDGFGGENSIVRVCAPG